jgi:hypothetical protein
MMGKSPAMTTERIEINAAIMMGKPVIRGTRITVELILRRLADGATASNCWKTTRTSPPRTSGRRWPPPKKIDHAVV